MPEDQERVRGELLEQYRKMLPLLEYLKARLKYDTARWVRTFGAKDDIIFSTRIKTFDRVYEKLLRKGVKLPRNATLRSHILSNDGTLDDLVGIRFVCFDAHQVIRLVSHFITTERVTISKCEYYASHKADSENALYRFLRANGFKPQVKFGREYEDISFVLRFTHPIDLYFDSDPSDLSTSGQRVTQNSSTKDKLSRVKALYSDILDSPSASLLTDIPRFPIECQIVTATQHIYNRAQRPLYEYVIQNQPGNPKSLTVDVADIEDRLYVMKASLLQVDHVSLSISSRFGVAHQFVPAITPGAEYTLDGRVPAGWPEVTRHLQDINRDLLPRILESSEPTHRRLAWLARILESFDLASNELTSGRYRGVILDRHLLTLTEIPQLDAPGIAFWSLQRIAILEILYLLLFSDDEDVRAQLIAHLANLQPPDSRDEHDGDAGSALPSAWELVAGRLFERLKHTDIAAATKMVVEAGEFEQLAGQVSRVMFVDPLVFWRYSTFMYRQREYLAAKREILVGLSVFEEFEALSKERPDVAFEVPDRGQFFRRLVEYEICHEIEGLRYDATSVAGIFEACAVLASKSQGWLETLHEVAIETANFLERARAVCYALLIRLCAASAGGLRERRALDQELGSQLTAFEELRAEALQNPGFHAIKIKTWWLLCEAIADPANSMEPLGWFEQRIKEVGNHTVEKGRFEWLCCDLIRLWANGDRPGSTDFNSRAAERLRYELREMRATESVAAQMRRIEEVLKEATATLARSRSVSETVKESWRQKLEKIALDGAGKIVVDTASAGLKALLGL